MYSQPHFVTHPIDIPNHSFEFLPPLEFHPIENDFFGVYAHNIKCKIEDDDYSSSSSASTSPEVPRRMIYEQSDSSSDSSQPSSPIRSRNRRSTKSDVTFVDVTPHLHLPQNQAAKMLGIPSSTLRYEWRRLF